MALKPNAAREALDEVKKRLGYDPSHPALVRTSEYRRSADGSDLDARDNPNDPQYIDPKKAIAEWEAERKHEVKKRPQQQAPSKWEQLQQAPSQWEQLQSGESGGGGIETGGLRTGSTSDKAQLIAPQWTKMARAARRLRKKGYTRAAEKLALETELARLDTPTIRSQDYRSELSKRHAEIAAQKARNLAAGYGAIRTPAMDAGNTPNDNKWANSPYTPTRYY